MLHIRKALEGIYYNTLVEASHKVDCRLDIFRTVLTSSKHFRMTLKLFLFCNIAITSSMQKDVLTVQVIQGLDQWRLVRLSYGRVELGLSRDL